MLGTYGVKTKKELKGLVGKPFPYVETSLFGAEFKGAGTYTCVGPDAYRDRRFYAQVTTDEDGIITKVQ